MEAKLHSIAAVILTLGLSLGCQTTDPSIELLESELRAQENDIYALDRQNSRLLAQLASCRKNNQALRQQLSQRAPSGEPSAKPSRSARPTAPRERQTPQDTRPRPPASPVPDPANVDPNDLEIPEIDLGPDAQPDAETDSLPGDGEAMDPSSDGIDAPETQPSDEADSDDQAVNVGVTRIVLNSRLTGGYDEDGQPGDEAIMVVVEPQNSAGEYVPLPGDLSVVVTDPNASEPMRELARWEFDASETVPWMKKSLLGRGVHLQLPWPNQPPSSERLKLFVRYRTATGEELIAQREVRVDLVATRNSMAMSDDRTSNASGNPRAVDPFLPENKVVANDLLPSQSLIPPRAPQVASGPSRNRSAVPNWSPNPSISRTQPNSSPGPVRRASRPQWQPFR